MKPQNIVEMLHLGSRDVGFAGADWVEELAAELVELLDACLDPVHAWWRRLPPGRRGTGSRKRPFDVIGA